MSPVQVSALRAPIFQNDIDTQVLVIKSSATLDYRGARHTLCPIGHSDSYPMTQSPVPKTMSSEDQPSQYGLPIFCIT